MATADQPRYNPGILNGSFAMADEESDDQRQHDRQQINQEFETIDEFIAEYVTNISRGGVFIRSKNPLPVGTKVTLKFSVILDDFETVEGEGEVVRVETEQGNTGMGVAFTRLTAESQKLIDDIVARREAEEA